MWERLPALIDDFAGKIVHKTFCCLVKGIPCMETVHAAATGPWAESICAKVAACTQGGQPAIRHMFTVLARQNPDLTALLTAPDESQPRVWTFQNLYHTSFPPPQFLLPDLLPVGLTILAGRPKIGKSWLAMQIAAAVGTGSTLFGRTAQQGTVLYLALEDTPGRIKDRGQKQGIPESALIILDTFNRTLDNADPMDTKAMTLPSMTTSCRSEASVNAFCHIRGDLSTARKNGQRVLNSLSLVLPGTRFVPACISAHAPPAA